MINSVNSNSSYLSMQTNNSLWNKLSAQKALQQESDSDKVQAIKVTDTSESSTSDNSVLSIEDLLGMMQSVKQSATIPSATDQTSSDSDLGSIDADGDGTISEDEYDSLISQMGITDALSAEDFFAQFDTDEDGEITSSEMDASKSAKPQPMGPPPEEKQSISSDIDTDGDGTISADEYEAAMTKMGVSDAASSEDFFAQFDTNSDGEISTDELNAKEPMGPPPTSTTSEENKELLSSIDTDEDSSLSEDEYESLVSQLNISGAPSAEEFFAQYDTNSDGEISSDEMVSSTQNTLLQSLTEEYKSLATNTLNAYENNYQYMFGLQNANLSSTYEI